MKITKRQLRRIIREQMGPGELLPYDEDPTADEWYESRHVDDQNDMSAEDLAQAIRDYSKELTGRRDTYGHSDDLKSLTWQELSDYYNDMFDSPEAMAAQKTAEEEAEILTNDELGYDGSGHPLESSPLRQGMSHRQESAMKITKRQLRKIIREQMTLVPTDVMSLAPEVEPKVMGGGGRAKLAKQQLQQIASTAQSLHDQLEDDDEIPEWTQSKIAVAEDNIRTVTDHLVYKIQEDPEI